MPAPKLFKKFLNRVKNSTTRFPCPSCGVVLLPKEFESHCSNEHDLNPMLCCVWCSGNRVWNSGEKNRHADHLLECMNNMMVLCMARQLPREEEAWSPPPRPTTFFLMDTTPTCEARNFFGNARLECVPEEGYEYILPAYLSRPPLTFQSKSMNMAASCVKKYLELGAEFYHVMVRAVAMESFLQAVDEGVERGHEISFLPFSCWCSGGNYQEKRFNHHRHLIVIYQQKEGHFAQIFSKVTPIEKPCRNYPCLLKKRIVSPLHLVNVILYVSNRHSQCQFTYEEEEEEESEEGGCGHLKHYYIWQGLPDAHGTRLALCTLWKGGVLQLVHQTCSRMDPRKLAQLPLKWIDGQYKIRIADLPGFKNNLVLPVSRCFVPCRYPTNYFFHVYDEKKLYFENSPFASDVELEQWVKIQAEGDNLFYHVMAEEYWIPTRFQQNFLECILPIYKYNLSLETQLASIKTELESSRRDQWKLEDYSVELNRKLEDGMSKLREAEQQIETLGTKHRENSYLKGEISNLKGENGRLNNDIAYLKGEIFNIRVENARLNNEIARLKSLYEPPYI